MRCVAIGGVSTRIVRNFGMLNTALFLPILSDQYKTGPGDVTFTKHATSTIGIAAIAVTIKASSRSTIRFKQKTFGGLS